MDTNNSFGLVSYFSINPPGRLRLARRQIERNDFEKTKPELLESFLYVDFRESVELRVSDLRLTI
jgi:hypothetical protein